MINPNIVPALTSAKSCFLSLILLHAMKLAAVIKRIHVPMVLKKFAKVTAKKKALVVWTEGKLLACILPTKLVKGTFFGLFLK